MNLKICGLNAICVGEGKPLLMLHGYLSQKECFLKQIEYFSRYYKVIAIDFEGFNGQSLPFAYSLDDYKKTLINVIDSLNCQKIDVIAHSFGARVLIKALAETNKIDKIVLTGAAGLKPRKSIKTRLSILKYKLAKKLVCKEKLSKYGSSDYRSLDNIMKHSFVKIVNEHLDDMVKKITNETLLVFGANDRETPQYMAKRFNKYITNSKLFFIEEAGHFCFIEKANQFNIIVKEFLI